MSRVVAIAFAIVALAGALVAPSWAQQDGKTGAFDDLIPKTKPQHVAEDKLEGFGKIKFGMARSTVEQILGREVVNTADAQVSYRTSVQGHPIKVTQWFHLGAATQANVKFGEARTGDGGVALFSRALEMLESSYGAPSGLFRSDRAREAFWRFGAGGRIVLTLKWVSYSDAFAVEIMFLPGDSGALQRF